MNVRVVSKSGNRHFALDPDNIIAACHGVDAFNEAKSYAIDHTKDTEEPAWIYEVELKCLGVMKTEKQVTFVPAKP